MTPATPAQLQALQYQRDALQAQLLAHQHTALAMAQERSHLLRTEAREQAKAESLQRVFYGIAERATAGLSFYDFLKTIHHLLGELVYAKNCFVALSNPSKGTKDFPYYVDERDGDAFQRNDVPLQNGMTEFVLRSGQPQRIDNQRLEELKELAEVTSAGGDMTFQVWLGVPLHVGGVCNGVLAVQAYVPGVDYDAQDTEILSFVGNHVAAAIERYRVIESLRQSEARNRLVVDSVGVGICVVQDKRMVLINPSLARILDHPLAFLMSHPYTAAIHPDDVAAVVNLRTQWQACDPPDQQFVVRIITQHGETRWLEYSTEVIEWGDRPADLLFMSDITDRRQAELQQKISLQKQGELNDMKSRFIAMANHEFRAPLDTILQAAVRLKAPASDLTPALKTQALQTMDDAVERMTRMLENVLLMGRADAGQIAFKPSPLSPTTVCQDLIQELHLSQPTCFQRIQLVLDLPPPHHTVVADETLMRNILSNLLSNACKFTPQGKSVFVTLRISPQMLTLTVRDEGIGIPEADLVRLFAPFFQASNAGALAGTGLGLSIVKKSVDWHHGRIDVSSQPNQGSCFTVQLPVTPQKPPQQAPKS